LAASVAARTRRHSLEFVSGTLCDLGALQIAGLVALGHDKLVLPHFLEHFWQTASASLPQSVFMNSDPEQVLHDEQTRAEVGVEALLS
jgi:hypothetical protein